ncbi:MAG: NmrA family NAD(P)-binding protein [Bacteroidales bacterium]|nr:NmrA family NAD(P)-binding protein [Bacteroidales bacterium]
MIPHYKIEQLILANKLEHIFLRPGYFMQNLTTTLVHEIKTQNKIFIPSGGLKFNWVDAQDIGLVGAHVLNNFDRYKNRPYEITGEEFLGFKEVAAEMTHVLGKTITYESPNLMRFYRAKRKLGIKKEMIFVMILLHYLPRLTSNKPRLVTTVKEITGRSPLRLADFIRREKHSF